MNAVAPAASAAAYELRFPSLHQDRRALAFPCDAAGRVDLDSLDERARCDYYFARTVVGRDFAMPAVCHPGPTRH